MILEGAKHIGQVLGLPSISAIIPNGICWELEDEGIQTPYAVYSVTHIGPITVTGFNQFEVRIYFFGKSLNQAAEKAGEVRKIIKEIESKWYDRGARSGYADTEAREGFIEVTYNFTLKIE